MSAGPDPLDNLAEGLEELQRDSEELSRMHADQRRRTLELFRVLAARWREAASHDALGTMDFGRRAVAVATLESCAGQLERLADRLQLGDIETAEEG